MPKRVQTRKNADVNQIAAAIIGLTGRDPEPQQDSRNPAAVALGKLGGSKGGKARAKSLSAKERAAIAKKAAQSRWGKRSKRNDN